MSRSAVRTMVSYNAGRAARLVGSLTADQRAMPSFLIVGAQRGGTTSLFKALLQHPSFIPPRMRKGVHYFDVAYGNGQSWYLGHFPRRTQLEARSRRIGAPVITGEASPYYMWHPAVPGRIAADVPGVKLVALLRDPVERAYSGYAHEFARGFETESFERALELEPSRLAGERERLLADPASGSHAMQHLAHAGRGEYVDQLLTLEAAVGRDRLMVLDSSDYFADPKPVFAQLCEFLGIPDAPDVTHDRHNARPRSTMSPELEARLRERYAPYDRRLVDWLGWTPSWCRDGSQRGPHGTAQSSAMPSPRRGQRPTGGRPTATRRARLTCHSTRATLPTLLPRHRTIRTPRAATPHPMSRLTDRLRHSTLARLRAPVR